MNYRNPMRTIVALALIAGAFSWSCTSPSAEQQTAEQAVEAPRAADEPSANKQAEAAPADTTSPKSVVITEVPSKSAPSEPAPVSVDKAAETTEVPPAPATSKTPAETKPQAVAEDTKPKRVEYAPGILIDWSVPQVEIASRVALREGLLELLLCRTGTKEHESVLVTDADPKRIHEALGLIGLEAGNPMMYDPQNDKYTPPAGQRLALEVQYGAGDEEMTIAAHEWLVTSEKLAPVEPPHWMFCGSRVEEGVYLAGQDGTIACVVDFDTALIGLAERHTSSNDALWLAAATDNIPEAGSECTLIVRALDTSPIAVVLTPESYFAIGETVIDALQLDALIKSRIRHYPQQRLLLSPAKETPNDFARVAGRCIIGSGIAAENLEMTLHPEDNATPADSAPPADPE